MRATVTVALVLLLAMPAHGQQIVRGTVETVENGRTLVIAGMRIRLWGIRAPTPERVCIGADGRAYRCGRLAAMMLEALTLDRTVECRVLASGGSDAAEAQCLTHSDLAGILVRTGQAIDIPDESGGYYQPEQAEAIARKAGFWINPSPWPFPKGKAEP